MKRFILIVVAIAAISISTHSEDRILTPSKRPQATNATPLQTIIVQLSTIERRMDVLLGETREYRKLANMKIAAGQPATAELARLDAIYKQAAILDKSRLQLEARRANLEMSSGKPITPASKLHRLAEISRIKSNFQKP